MAKKLTIKCSGCGSRYFYTLKDETRVCRKCGHRWKDGTKSND